MTKTELIDIITENTGLKGADVSDTVNATLDAISTALIRGDTIRLVGFGTFENRKRAERTSRNPKTGEPVVVPASVSPTFKPSKVLKEAVNRRQS